jgi:peptidoglycan L-alanyl-D-glutamate endopeptidase CwlK
VSAYALGERSRQRLQGVHPDLVKVVERAIELTTVDFMVTEGLRSMERQIELVKAKKSKTMNSRHLTGHAVDLAAWVKKSVSWEWKHYETIALAMKTAAMQVGVKIEWGGDWQSFKDGPHFQLPWKEYPLP